LIAAGRAAGDEPGAGASELARLLEAGYDAIARLGKAERGAKTMLDALGEAVSAARAAARGGADVGAALRAAAAAADSGARATREMIPRHGRAGWLAERAAGHEDAGARLVAIVLAAASA
jgi:dihydroxyacetone kinase-like protein